MRAAKRRRLAAWFLGSLVLVHFLVKQDSRKCQGAKALRNQAAKRAWRELANNPEEHKRI